jgi:hypothetical protein
MVCQYWSRIPFGHSISQHSEHSLGQRRRLSVLARISRCGNVFLGVVIRKPSSLDDFGRSLARLPACFLFWTIQAVYYPFWMIQGFSSLLGSFRRRVTRLGYSSELLLVDLPRLNKSLHSLNELRELQLFSFFLRLTTYLPFRKVEMGSGFDPNLPSAPLTSQESEIRRLKATVNSLQQELQTKDWIVRKRLEDELSARFQLYAEMACMQSCYTCDARWSVRIHNHSATSLAAPSETHDTCFGDPILSDPFLSAKGSQGSYYFTLLNHFFTSYANDLGIGRENFIATVTHPCFPKGYLHLLYTLGLGQQQLLHIGFVQQELNKRGPQDPAWQARQISDKLVLALSDRESVRLILLPLIIRQFHLLFNVSAPAASGIE